MMSNEEKTKKNHPILKALVIILIVILVLIGIGAIFLFREYKKKAAEVIEAQKGIIGTEAPDFTATTTDGEELTLSKILEEKEVVVLNVFTTWCGPCKIEFPEFDKNYQKYKDKLEIIALSGDSDETMEDVAAFKEENGLSFPMGIIGEDGTFAFVPVNGYPTTMIIDRNRKVVFCESGTIRNGEAFEALVTSFMGDDYDGSPAYIYQVSSHDGKAYVGGVVLNIKSDDGTEMELTTDETGYAYFLTKDMHTYEVDVASVPDGYSLEKLDPKTVGPQSGYITVKLKAK